MLSFEIRLLLVGVVDILLKHSVLGVEFGNLLSKCSNLLLRGVKLATQVDDDVCQEIFLG